MYDVIIVGSGPAGISAAIYLKRANKNILVISKNGLTYINGTITGTIPDNYTDIAIIRNSKLFEGSHQAQQRVIGNIMTESYKQESLCADYYRATPLGEEGIVLRARSDESNLSSSTHYFTIIIPSYK